MAPDDLKASLLDNKIDDETRSFSCLTPTNTNPVFNKILFQSSIATIYTLPFAFSAYSLHHQIAQQNFTLITQSILTTLNILGAVSILTIGYHLYGKHTYSMMTQQDIEELTGHVKTLSDQYEINPQPSPMTHSQKIAALFFITVMTLPLGWTKSASLGEVMGIPCRLIWLLLYSLIDAGPHINHLQFWKQACAVFSNHFTPLQRCGVILLMFGHAAEDMIDLANTESTLFNIANNSFTLWLIMGILSEFFSAGIESVIHSEETHDHHDSLTCSNKVLRATIIFGQIATSVYNTLATLHENPTAYHNEYKDFLFIASLMGYAFIARETIHHLEHEHENYDSGHTEACHQTRFIPDTPFKQMRVNQGQVENNEDDQQSQIDYPANSAV